MAGLFSRFKLGAKLTLLSLSLACPLSAQAAEDAATHLYELLSSFNSFSADFEQLVLDNAGSRLQSSQGTAVLQRPNRFNWKTTEPFPQLLVSNGKTLWIYDQDLEQVTQKPVDAQISSTPALLLSGNLEQLEQAFKIAGPTTGGDGVFRLTPTDENAMFVVMRIMFADGVPKEMQMEDNLGQRTGVAFTNIKLNPPVSDADFNFKAPAGVDLIIEE